MRGCEGERNVPAMKNGYIGSTGDLCVLVMTDDEICYVPREGRGERKGMFVTDEAAELFGQEAGHIFCGIGSFGGVE